MNEYLEQVAEFHLAFRHPIKDDIDLSDEKLNGLRYELLREELLELYEGMARLDPHEVLDALCDLQYVLSGAVLALGFTEVFDKAFAEVHRSNMSKLFPDGSVKYREDGKVLKPPHFSLPNLEQFL